MGAEDWLRASPQERAEAARAEIGGDLLAHWCGDVLAGRVHIDSSSADDVPDPRWLAGRQWERWGPARTWPERNLDYWPRVWAARTLLHIGDDGARGEIIGGLSDQSWRVREMCAKVVASHEIGEAGDACARIVRTDANSRVRIAALRALAVIGESEHAGAVLDSLDDDEIGADASTTLRAMEERLDRPLRP
ncbi:HEAT repeat domain-containing protein [Paramicrobacterium fandaimingii]|uniref:HEAT repeat domain-containing protein n=1 Tax=Paramicrobacterium fandaimingii TaxID=2708079 RepID=UPI0014205C85|nr:HEAT repeat domain-containing protein [Microbacterium fandaimingii]